MHSAGAGPIVIWLSLLFYCPADALALPDYLYEELDERNIEAIPTMKTSREVVPELDILYMTRVQKERFEETEFHQVKSRSC